MPEVLPEGLSFGEAIRFFETKVRLPTRAWSDIKGGAHARSFVMAGATRDALLSDMHRALTATFKAGRTRADFLEDFDAIVAHHGWDFRGERRWRAALIYDTNLRMAHAAGRWEQIAAQAEREAKFGRTLYLRYVAVHDNKTRPDHAAWHGTTLPHDHPWWRTHYPPNGWNCRCSVQSLTERDLARYGLSPTPEDQVPADEIVSRPVTLADGSVEIWETPRGIDPGFDYNVGESWLDGAVPPPLSGPLPPPAAPARPIFNTPPLPAPRPAPPEVTTPLADGLGDEAYIKAFLGVFGADLGRPVPFRDAAGNLLAIGDSLFVDRKATAIARRADPAATAWKVDKNGRHLVLPLLAYALQDPDEIWLDWFMAKGGPILRRRYLRRFAEVFRFEGSQPIAGLVAAFEWTSVGWTGITIHPSARDSQTEDQRHGVLLWRRPDEGG
ncbi:PBECR2 nuclease fold domain-containing protein [Pararhodospirillum oryzae]|uniref:Virion morphogenesis protein n=1 Tax=Pararhodospirillum oryzae TaxID=478448 RepID=A0A512HA62_9PROT|nr:PBECR2 nuclease fold domain-containing protein [Pararhodospirillum oryzae]GEO82280.1 virion morphogenesis protein [Pararhodospirillum oryzae]